MPEIVTIPVSKLMPNEDQPRHRFRLYSIQKMADSLKDLGQQTLLKVRRLTEQEMASYSKWDILDHGSNMPPNVLTFGQQGFEYLVIGGHRRLAGALLAGLETLDCQVLNIAPEDTHLSSLMDNSLEEMDWWDWDLAIEKEHQDHPDLSLRQLGKRLGVSKSKVGRALLLTGYLDEMCRDMISNNLNPETDNDGFRVDVPEEDLDEETETARLPDTQPGSGAPTVPPRDTKPTVGTRIGPSGRKEKSEYRITESILLALAPLADEALDALELIFGWEMNEAVVKRFVQWIVDGNEPRDFDPNVGSKDKTKEEDPLAEAWKGLDPGIKVKHKGGDDYEIHLKVTGGPKALKTAQAAQKAIQGGILERIMNQSE
jgi:hypothetical protein